MLCLIVWLIWARGIEGGGGAFGAIILIYPAGETERLAATWQTIDTLIRGQILIID